TCFSPYLFLSLLFSLPVKWPCVPSSLPYWLAGQAIRGYFGLILSGEYCWVPCYGWVVATGSPRRISSGAIFKVVMWIRTILTRTGKKPIVNSVFTDASIPIHS